MSYDQAITTWLKEVSLSEEHKESLIRIYQDMRKECGDLIKHYIEKACMEQHDIEDFKMVALDVVKEKPSLLTEKEQADIFRHYRNLFKNLLHRQPRKVLKEDYEEIR